MSRPTSPLDAFDEPPRVLACDGEVVVMGPLVNAAYTPRAAKALIARLTAAVEEAERQQAGN